MAELPTGLHFYWYEPKAGDEHPRYWGQLCLSMHRLAFVREELAAATTLSDLAGGKVSGTVVGCSCLGLNRVHALAGLGIGGQFTKGI